MKIALLLCSCALVFAQAPAAQPPAGQPSGQSGEKREEQDLQLSRTRAAAGPRVDPNWPPKGATPRTADGHPDLSGNWQPNAIRQNVDMIGSGVDVPLLPEAKAVYEKH